MAITKPEKRIGALMKQGDGVLGPILAKIHLLASLDKAIKPHLPTELAADCLATNLEAGHLTLSARNASVATRLRFQVGDILAKLRQNSRFAGLLHIRCRVSPSAFQPAKIEMGTVVRTPPRLSVNAREALRDFSHQCEDPQLAGVISRILRGASLIKNH